MSEKPTRLTPDEIRAKAQEEKARRLAEALRHNLKRRKAAASSPDAPEADA